MAMFSYLDGDATTALEFLHGLEDDPDVWVDFYMLYNLTGELRIAEYYANRAAEMTCGEATQPLLPLRLYPQNSCMFQFLETERGKLC